MRHIQGVLLAGAAMLLPASPAFAQVDVEALSAELGQARAQIAEQRRLLDAQEQRLRALEARMTEVAAVQQTGVPVAGSGAAAPGAQAARQAGVEQVGEAPIVEMPQVAVLGDQGNVITRSGQLTGELQLEYGRADRNRAIFRGIEVIESVLIGVFDINESRQDVLTAAASVRYGLSSRLEVGVRAPFVYRSDKSVLAPIAGSTGNDPAATRDTAASASGLGDLEFSLRYQLTAARRGRPFLIGNVQVVAPTGTDPFSVERDENGLPLVAATGAGFWGVSPSITAILPTDPAVLFGSLGFTHSFGRNVDTRIGDVIIERVQPGNAISASAGIGISLNQRTSFNLGYAHSWVMGSDTRTRFAEPGPNDPPFIEATSRDLQIGRFLFGVTYRVSDTVNLNWAVEIGATDDATDVRTVLRIPIVIAPGS